MEDPWDAVRVRVSVPREAALRLRRLLDQCDPALRSLGVLSVGLGDNCPRVSVGDSCAGAQQQSSQYRSDHCHTNHHQQSSQYRSDHCHTNHHQQSSQYRSDHCHTNHHHHQQQQRLSVCSPASTGQRNVADLMSQAGGGVAAVVNGVASPLHTTAVKLVPAAEHAPLAYHVQQHAPRPLLVQRHVAPPPYPGSGTASATSASLGSPLLVNLLKSELTPLDGVTVVGGGAGIVQRPPQVRSTAPAAYTHRHASPQPPSATVMDMTRVLSPSTARVAGVAQGTVATTGIRLGSSASSHQHRVRFYQQQQQPSAVASPVAVANERPAVAPTTVLVRSSAVTSHACVTATTASQLSQSGGPQRVYSAHLAQLKRAGGGAAALVVSSSLSSSLSSSTAAAPAGVVVRARVAPPAAVPAAQLTSAVARCVGVAGTVGSVVAAPAASVAGRLAAHVPPTPPSAAVAASSVTCTASVVTVGSSLCHSADNSTCSTTTTRVASTCSSSSCLPYPASCLSSATSRAPITCHTSSSSTVLSGRFSTASSSGTPVSVSPGKPHQLLINPLTGLLEPMVASDSGSDSEAEPRESAASVTAVTTNDASAVALAALNAQVLSASTSSVLTVTSTPVTARSVVGHLLVSNAVTSCHSRNASAVTSADTVASVLSSSHTPQEQQQHATDRIRLRLKLDKSDQPASAVYRMDGRAVTCSAAATAASVLAADVDAGLRVASTTTAELAGDKVAATGVAVVHNGVCVVHTQSSADARAALEPRVPPLHISLRGRNAAVVISKDATPVAATIVAGCGKNKDKAKIRTVKDEDGGAAELSTTETNVAHSVGESPFKIKFKDSVLKSRLKDKDKMKQRVKRKEEDGGFGSVKLLNSCYSGRLPGASNARDKVANHIMEMDLRHVPPVPPDDIFSPDACTTASCTDTAVSAVASACVSAVSPPLLPSSPSSPSPAFCLSSVAVSIGEVRQSSLSAAPVVACGVSSQSTLGSAVKATQAGGCTKPAELGENSLLRRHVLTSQCVQRSTPLVPASSSVSCFTAALTDQQAVVQAASLRHKSVDGSSGDTFGQHQHGAATTVLSTEHGGNSVVLLADDSGIESMDTQSEKSPNQDSESPPHRKDELDAESVHKHDLHHHQDNFQLLVMASSSNSQSSIQHQSPLSTCAVSLADISTASSSTAVVTDCSRPVFSGANSSATTTNTTISNGPVMSPLAITSSATISTDIALTRCHSNHETKMVVSSSPPCIASHNAKPAVSTDSVAVPVVVSACDISAATAHTAPVVSDIGDCARVCSTSASCSVVRAGACVESDSGSQCISNSASGSCNNADSSSVSCAAGQQIYQRPARVCPRAVSSVSTDPEGEAGSHHCRLSCDFVSTLCGSSGLQHRHHSLQLVTSNTIPAFIVSTAGRSVASAQTAVCTVRSGVNASTAVVTCTGTTQTATVVRTCTSSVVPLTLPPGVKMLPIKLIKAPCQTSSPTSSIGSPAGSCADHLVAVSPEPPVLTAIVCSSTTGTASTNNAAREMAVSAGCTSQFQSQSSPAIRTACVSNTECSLPPPTLHKMAAASCVATSGTLSNSVVSCVDEEPELLRVKPPRYTYSNPDRLARACESPPLTAAVFRRESAGIRPHNDNDDDGGRAAAVVSRADDDCATTPSASPPVALAGGMLSRLLSGQLASPSAVTANSFVSRPVTAVTTSVLTGTRPVSSSSSYSHVSFVSSAAAAADTAFCESEARCSTRHTRSSSRQPSPCVESAVVINGCVNETIVSSGGNNANPQLPLKFDGEDCVSSVGASTCMLGASVTTKNDVSAVYRPSPNVSSVSKSVASVGSASAPCVSSACADDAHSSSTSGTIAALSSGKHSRSVTVTACNTVIAASSCVAARCDATSSLTAVAASTAPSTTGTIQCAVEQANAVSQIPVSTRSASVPVNAAVAVLPCSSLASVCKPAASVCAGTERYGDVASSKAVVSCVSALKAPLLCVSSIDVPVSVTSANTSTSANTFISSNILINSVTSTSTPTITTSSITSTNIQTSTTSSSSNTSTNFPIDRSFKSISTNIPAITTPVTSTDTIVTSTDTPITSTDTPITSTVTPVTSTATPVTSTATTVTSTATTVTSTDTPVTSTATPITSTDTTVTSTATPVTSTDTTVTSTATPVTSTATPVTSTATPVTSTDTTVTSTATPVTSTATPVTSSDTPVTSTATPVTSTDTTVASTATPVTSTDTPVTSTDTAVTSTDTASASICTISDTKSSISTSTSTIASCTSSISTSTSLSAVNCVPVSVRPAVGITGDSGSKTSGANVTVVLNGAVDPPPATARLSRAAAAAKRVNNTSISQCSESVSRANCVSASKTGLINSEDLVTAPTSRATADPTNTTVNNVVRSMRHSVGRSSVCARAGSRGGSRSSRGAVKSVMTVASRAVVAAAAHTAAVVGRRGRTASRASAQPRHQSTPPVPPSVVAPLLVAPAKRKLRNSATTVASTPADLELSSSKRRRSSRDK